MVTFTYDNISCYQLQGCAVICFNWFPLQSELNMEFASKIGTPERKIIITLPKKLTPTTVNELIFLFQVTAVSFLFSRTHLKFV